MDAKLTLRLEKSIIIPAKEYAANNNRSLSKLVEAYFRHLGSENIQKEKYPPLIKRLSGVISEDDLKNLSKEDDGVNIILQEEKG